MPEPDKLQWRSSFGWPSSSPAGRTDPKRGLVIHYDSANQNLAGKPHSACVAYWKRTRNFHTGPSRGWADIGYSWGACAHGYVMEGRGLFRTQAAQPGGNSTYYSVTLMTGPNDTVTPEQINAVRQLREWLMEPASSISGTVKGHRDFISTSCPGDKAYRMVRDGTFTKPATWGGAAPSTPATSEDDVPERNMYTTTTAYNQTVAPGEWTTVNFDRRWEDSKGWETKKPEPSFVFGPAFYAASAFVRVDGLEKGQEFQMRLSYYRQDDAGRYERYASMPINSPVHDGGQGHFTYTWTSHVSGSKKGRVRLEVMHYGESDVTITSARADALYWKG